MKSFETVLVSYAAQEYSEMTNCESITMKESKTASAENDLQVIVRSGSTHAVFVDTCAHATVGVTVVTVVVAAILRSSRTPGDG